MLEPGLLQLFRKKVWGGWGSILRIQQRSFRVRGPLHLGSSGAWVPLVVGGTH